MNPPAVVWARLACCVGAGMALGLGMDFLRPIRHRIRLLFQLITSAQLVLWWCWISFNLCRGDIRLGYFGGMWAGYFVWRWALSRPVTGLFGRFWRIIGRIIRRIFAPARIIFKKILKIRKFFFASWKKWVTIARSNRRRNRLKSGGTANDKDPAAAEQLQTGSAAGLAPAQGSGHRHYRCVYGDPDRPGGD